MFSASPFNASLMDWLSGFPPASRISLSVISTMRPRRARIMHESRRVLRGDDVREEARPQNRVALGQVHRPEGSPTVRARILSGHAVDEDIQPVMIPVDAFEE